MRISVQFQKKVKGAEEYSSLCYNVGIESEPPAEVSQDRDRLKQYTRELFAEAKARVEEQVEQQRHPAPAQEGDASASPDSRRVPPQRNGARPVQRPGMNGNGHTARRNGTAHSDGEAASIKQINYVRALGKDAGYTPDQLLDFAEEVTGRSGISRLDALSKRDCSLLIENLKDGRE